MDTLLKDIRFAGRSLRRQPGFAAIAIITLALGIGINSALFSVVNSVLLNPLPFPKPEQLVTLDQSKPNFEFGAIPYPNFQDLEKENRTFAAMAISRGASFSLIGAGEAERVTARQVSSEIFSVLDLKLLRGRSFARSEDQPGAGGVAIISADLWQRKFGAAEDILSKTITLDDKSYSIIGVVPANFGLFSGTDVYVPIGQSGLQALERRGAGLGLHGIGRLKPGVTIEQGQADLNGIMARLATTYPGTNKGNGAKVSSLKERMVGGIGSTLWLLLGAVGFVLLIACVNVSNLLLARSTGRNREFAIRSALGAGRWRLLRQSLIESTLLAITGGALGLLLAGWGTSAAVAVLPTTLPRASEIRLDFRVVLFALGVSLLTGILSGLVPALRSSRSGLSETLKEGGRGSSGARGRAQGVLVAVEMALALVLLVGAGLMIRSLGALWRIDPGFQPDNVLTFGLSLSPSLRSATPDAIRASLRQLNDQLRATPGVRAVSFTSGGIPLQGADDTVFWIEGQPIPATGSEMNSAWVYRVEPEYLAALGIELKQGRFFTNQDKEKSQDVIVIDEVFARKYFGTENPIGRRILQGAQAPPQEIIGVVRHVKQWSLDGDDRQTLQAQFYEPFRQFPDNAMASLAAGVLVFVRYDGSTAPFDSIRRVVQNHNQENVVSQPQTMTEVVADSLAAQRFSMILLEAFAVMALLLASLGLYGVISYFVGQRTHELGIRMALGAQRRDVLRLILGDGMKMTLAGVVIGVLAALGLTRLLVTMLYGVSPTDPLTYGVIALLLTVVAVLACILPARRAMKVDPLIALRYE